MSSLTDRLVGFGIEPTPPTLRTRVANNETAAEATVGESGVEVLVRCRPPLSPSDGKTTGKLFGLAAENGRDKVCLKIDEGEGTSRAKSASRLFRCNRYCGPTAMQQDIFEAALPLIDRTIEGYNGTIFCYGVTGSGKTYTMSGPPEDIGNSRQDPESVGVVQRVATKIFESIRDRSSNGEVYSVEASFLEIYSKDGSREQLIDLLSDKEKQLELKQDPLHQYAFTCDGLRQVAIRTPDEMCNLLRNGQQRLTFMETSANCHSSRSHCIFMLSVECLMDSVDGGEPRVRRGKLMLVDLAGSESVKKVQALNNENEELRQKQAIGINRVLSSLATVVNNINRGISSGYRDSALTMLIRDCLGGNSRALLVATIGPELEGLDETVKTLTFAQQMMSVRNKAVVNRIEKDQSSLIKMRQRHADCIRILDEKTSEAKEEEAEEIRNLKQEVDDLSKKLLTKESAEKTLEDIRTEQLRICDEMRDEMAQAMGKELERMREQSLQDLNVLRQSVEKHVAHADDAQVRRCEEEEQEERLGKMKISLQDAVQSRRAMEEDAANLRIRLASAEERSKMLQARQEEVRNERIDFEDERKSLRQQSEQQWQRLTTLEGDTQRYKAEAEAQRAEVASRLAGLVEDAEQQRAKRDEWRTREADLQKDMNELYQKVEGAKRRAEIEALRVETERREACAELHLRIERLEVEAAAQVDQMSSARRRRAQLEAECQEAKHNQEVLRQQGAFELKQCQDELDEAMGREKELMQMLHEIQEGIITASGPPGHLC